MALLYEPLGVHLEAGKKEDPSEPPDHALGRSRGGYSTKLHLLCDVEGHPLSFHLTPGQAHESTIVDLLLETADSHLFDADGIPVPWPSALAGDKGYRADWIDTCLTNLGISPVIPSKSNEDRDTRRVPFRLCLKSPPVAMRVSKCLYRGAFFCLKGNSIPAQRNALGFVIKFNFEP